MTTFKNITETLDTACQSLCRNMERGRSMVYVLTMLLMKHLSDTAAEKRAHYEQVYGGDEARVQRALRRETFIMDETSDFASLYKSRTKSGLGQRINLALSLLETHNGDKLLHVFKAVDFNSPKDLGSGYEKDGALILLLEQFHNLDLSPANLETPDILGKASEFLITKSAEASAKTMGVNATPGQVSELLAALVSPQENERIYDPACGSGGLLLKAASRVTSGRTALYGQEIDPHIRSVCTMNMILHGIGDARIWQGDTLAHPQNKEKGELMTFQCIVCAPPFNLSGWDKGLRKGTGSESPGSMSAELDPYGRFGFGVPVKGDYAFVLHMLRCLNETSGRMAVALPLGVLSRGGAETTIRRNLIKHNLLDAVIGLPGNMFYGTRSPACIMVLKKNRQHKDVLFIDASRESDSGNSRLMGTLKEGAIGRIVQTYEKRTELKGYSHSATPREILGNDCNLTIARYVNTDPENEEWDMHTLQCQIKGLEAELQTLQGKIQRHLNILLPQGDNQIQTNDYEH